MRIKIITILCFIMAIFFQSCQSYSDGRILKKFISRFNAEEYASAATYIYPGDRMNLAFFDKEIKKLAPHAYIKLLDYKTEKSKDDRFIKAKIQWVNCTPDLMNYFKSINHPVNPDGIQEVNLKIRETVDGETISFVWGIPNVLSDNLWIASVKEEDDKPVSKIEIYSEPSIKSKKEGELDKSVIVGKINDDGWMPVYQVNNQGVIYTSYIQENTDFSLDRTAYFSLGIFDSMSVILALIIIIVIIVPLYYSSSIISSIFSGLPVVGPIVCIVLILGIIYVIYQLLEKILFELFIINLPY